MKWKKGMIQVYTGNGKGKTTASLGLALRAAGNGLYTFIGQFMKGQDYGELYAVKKLRPFITIEQFGLKEFVHPDSPRPVDFQMAERGLERMEEILTSGIFNIVIFDEINVTVHFGLLKAEDVINVVKKKPEHVEVILTGRYAPQEFLDMADLVTEMKEIKHYFNKGIQAREGVEF